MQNTTSLARKRKKKQMINAKYKFISEKEKKETSL